MTFRTNYEGKGQWKLIAAWMNDVGRFLNGIRGINGTQVTPNQSGSIDIEAPDSGGSGGGGSGGGGTEAFPAKITGHVGAGVYSAELYMNGKEAEKLNEQGVLVPDMVTGQIEVMTINQDDVIPAGTWVVAVMSVCKITGGVGE